MNAWQNLGMCYDTTLISDGWEAENQVESDIFAHLFVSDAALAGFQGANVDESDPDAKFAAEEADVQLPDALPSLRSSLVYLKRAVAVAKKRGDVAAQSRACSTCCDINVRSFIHGSSVCSDDLRISLIS